MSHINVTYETPHPDPYIGDVLHRLVNQAVSATEWEIAGLDLHEESILCGLGVNLNSRLGFMATAWRELRDVMVYQGGHHIGICNNNGARYALITIG